MPGELSGSACNEQSTPPKIASREGTNSGPFEIRRGVRRVESTAQRGKREVEGTGTGDLWQRLSAVDFMNRALILAATLLLCAVPFLLIVSTLAGHSATAGPVHGIGTVSALMSLFIAIGVVQVLGAAFGLVWTEHGSFRGALRRLRRRQP